MTDTERRRVEAICEVAGVSEIDDLSDGFHTFRQLYYQRMMLFATIVKQNKENAWKSLRHEDGELCFGGGWFIVGIDTPEGSYTYHYEDSYFSLFDCKELPRAKHWDGHTEKDVTRLLSLKSEPHWILCSERLPGEYMSFYATVKSLVDNRERWVIEGMYTRIEEWGKIPMIDRGEAKVTAWMPKCFPEPWRGDAE